MIMKVSIGRAAKELGVSIDTLRRWERQGKIIAERTASGHRRYDLAQLVGVTPRLSRSEKATICYARVSAHDQKEEVSFEDELVSDVLEIITVFSARLYGSRSRKNKKLIDSLREAASNV